MGAGQARCWCEESKSGEVVFGSDGDVPYAHGQEGWYDENGEYWEGDYEGEWEEYDENYDWEEYGEEAAEAAVAAEQAEAELAQESTAAPATTATGDEERSLLDGDDADAGAGDRDLKARQPTQDLPAKERKAPMTRSEETEEKLRLQKLVSDFAKRSVQGIPCRLYIESETTWSDAEYRLDGKLERLSLCKKGVRAPIFGTCSVADIVDIYSFSGDGATPFPAKMISTLALEDRGALAMVVAKPSDGKAQDEQRFILTDNSQDGLATFLECMRVLVVYARARQSRDR